MTNIPEAYFVILIN